MRQPALTEPQLAWLREHNRAFARTEAKMAANRAAFLRQREPYAEQLARQEEERRQAAGSIIVAQDGFTILGRALRHAGSFLVFSAAMALIVYGFMIWPEANP